MTTSRILPALLGFAFVVVTFAENLGVAILALLGALVFHLAAGLLRGELSVDELRDRAEGARSGFAQSGRTPN
ncbi:MAG: hypothetical protein JHD16_08725 [Solirubrobacteraceae bacterium]|nr:hypothetical protein [Solirubrobacteraceae bacterium]